MAGGTTKRPGRPLIFDPSRMPNASDQVKTLDEALIKLLNRAGTGLTATMRSAGISGGRQNLWRQLNRDQGPDKHIVMAIVQHCAALIDDEDEDELLARFLALWQATQGDQGSGQDNRRAIHPPVTAEPVNPALVAAVLDLVAGGDDVSAAEMMATQYPHADPVVGGILAEIGRITPWGAADLLAAVISHSGYDLARTYMDCLAEADETTAARVMADPRLQPPPEPEPETDPGLPPGIPDPADINGRRRAAKIRRGDIAQAVAEIVHESQFEPPPQPSDDGELATWREAVERRAQRRRADAQDRYDVIHATDLVMYIARNAGDDAGPLLGRLLGALMAEDHAELAARALAAAATAAPGHVGEVLGAMNRRELTEALDLLASSDWLDDAEELFPILVEQAPPPVAAHLLIEWELRSSPLPAVSFSRLRSPAHVLTEMVAYNHALAASFLSRQVGVGSFTLAYGPDEPAIIAAVLDLASADVKAAGRLLGEMVNRGAAEASVFIFRVGAAAGNNEETTWLAATLLDAAVRLEPARVPALIAQIMQESGSSPGQEEDSGNLLDHLVERHPKQGSRVVEAMLSRDLTHVKAQLPRMIRAGNLALASEVLKQIAAQDQTCPWDLVICAVTDRNLQAALEILEACPL